MLDSPQWFQFLAGLEASDICGVVLDIDSGVIVWSSVRFEEFTRRNKADLTGQPLESVFPGPLASIVFEFIDEGPIREYPVELSTKDRGTLRAIADLNSVRVAHRELTVIKIHAARGSIETLGGDEQLRALTDTLPAPAFIWRPDTFEILHVNRPLEDVWGRPRGNLVGRRVAEFVQNMDFLRKQVELRLKGAPYSQVEVLIRDESGRLRTWLGSSTVIGYSGHPALLTAITDVTERIEMEAAVRRSEKNFSLLVENVPEGIIVHCGGRVVFANPVALRMSGYTSLEEMRQVPVIELIHPDDRPAVADRMRAVIEGRLQLEPLRERVVRRDGTILDVETMGAPTEFEGQPAALIIVRDISDRLAREAELRESELKYRTLVQSVNDTIFQLDTAGRFTFLSGGTFAGIPSEEEIVGRQFADFIHPGDLEALRASYRDTLAGTLKPHEFRVRANDGSWRYVRTSSRPIHDREGSVVGLIGVMVDLTERIERENALRESAAKLAEATHVARLSTWEFNPSDEVWTMSPEAFEHLGIANLPSEEQSRAFAALIHPEDAERLRQLTQEAIAGTDHFEIEFRCVLANGETRYLHSSGRVERSEEGRPRRMYGVTQDVTEQKLREEERLQIEVQLQRAQKLDSLTVLAGGVAHDFNNLLTGILGYAELLKTAVEPHQKTLRYVDEIQRITRRAADLTRQLLAYSGRGKLAARPIDLMATVEEFVPLLVAVLPKSVELSTESFDSVPPVEADPAQIKQALMNLVLNASESMSSDKGRIRIGLRLRDIENDLSVDVNRPLATPRGRYAAIEVADNGMGMSPEQLRRICDPFFSTKFVGRGLGLSAVHGIVQAHSGSIHIASEPGLGTTVEILLPIDSAPRKGKNATHNASASRKETPATVLVVDDEDIVRSYASDVLTASGFEVIEARDGEECIACMAASPGEIDAILLDLSMPRMNGQQTLERLVDLYPETPVILASGYPEAEMRERFNGTAPQGFLQKPFNANQLLESVRAGIRAR